MNPHPLFLKANNPTHDEIIISEYRNLQENFMLQNIIMHIEQFNIKQYIIETGKVLINSVTAYGTYDRRKIISVKINFNDINGRLVPFFVLFYLSTGENSSFKDNWIPFYGYENDIILKMGSEKSGGYQISDINKKLVFTDLQKEFIIKSFAPQTVKNDTNVTLSVENRIKTTYYYGPYLIFNCINAALKDNSIEHYVNNMLLFDRELDSDDFVEIIRCVYEQNVPIMQQHAGNLKYKYLKYKQKYLQLKNKI